MARARSRPTQTGQLVAAGVARVCVVCVLSNYGQRHIELLSSKMRTEANRRRHLHRGMQGQQTPKHKTPGRKTTRGSSGRTVSDEILELQTTSRHLISPAQNFRNELSETAMQYFSLCREKSQEYRTVKPAESSQQKVTQLCLCFHFRFLHKEQTKNP